MAVLLANMSWAASFPRMSSATVLSAYECHFLIVCRTRCEERIAHHNLDSWGNRVQKCYLDDFFQESRFSEGSLREESVTQFLEILRDGRRGTNLICLQMRVGGLWRQKYPNELKHHGHVVYFLERPFLR